MGLYLKSLAAVPFIPCQEQRSHLSQGYDGHGGSPFHQPFTQPHQFLFRCPVIHLKMPLQLQTVGFKHIRRSLQGLGKQLPIRIQKHHGSLFVDALCNNAVNILWNSCRNAPCQYKQCILCRIALQPANQLLQLAGSYLWARFIQFRHIPLILNHLQIGPCLSFHCHEIRGDSQIRQHIFYDGPAVSSYKARGDAGSAQRLYGFGDIYAFASRIHLHPFDTV